MLLQGYFTYLYIAGILFLLYVYCFLLHEASCCGSGPPAPGTVGRNTYFHVSGAPKCFGGNFFVGSSDYLLLYICMQLYRYGVYTVNIHLRDSSSDMRRLSLNSWVGFLSLSLP